MKNWLIIKNYQTTKSNIVSVLKIPSANEFALQFIYFAV